MTLRVTKLRRDPDGVWRANVSRNGTTLAVERRGSWTTIPEAGRCRDLLPEVAAELQRRLPQSERRWRGGRPKREGARHG